MSFSLSQSAGCAPPIFPGTYSPSPGAGATNGPLRAPAPYPLRPDSCRAERHVARRDRARAWLAEIGMAPQRVQGGHSSELPRWRVPGWTSLFDDFELIALAEARGMADV